MFCHSCGAANKKGAKRCVQCGTTLVQEVAEKPESTTIPTYLAQSILVTLFCCLPFGIPAIVYAAQVSSKLNEGDSDEALSASKNARMWCWIAFGFGLTVMLISILGGIAAALIEEFA